MLSSSSHIAQSGRFEVPSVSIFTLYGLLPKSEIQLLDEIIIASSILPLRARTMPPKAGPSPRKGASTTTKLGNDPTVLPLPTLLKLLCSSGPKPPHLTMSQAMSAASKLVPKGYNSTAKLRTLTQVDMSALGIQDEEIRKGIMAVIGKAGGKGSGDSPDVRRKRTRESDLDRPLPSRAPKETTVDEDFDFDEIEAEEVSRLRMLVRTLDYAG